MVQRIMRSLFLAMSGLANAITFRSNSKKNGELRDTFSHKAQINHKLDPSRRKYENGISQWRGRREGAEWRGEGVCVCVEEEGKKALDSCGAGCNYPGKRRNEDRSGRGFARAINRRLVRSRSVRAREIAQSAYASGTPRAAFVSRPETNDREIKRRRGLGWMGWRKAKLESKVRILGSVRSLGPVMAAH
jgi:hypothetical protein